jgi:hypothetical protein
LALRVSGVRKWHVNFKIIRWQSIEQATGKPHCGQEHTIFWFGTLQTAQESLAYRSPNRLRDGILVDNKHSEGLAADVDKNFSVLISKLSHFVPRTQILLILVARIMRSIMLFCK